VAGTLEIACDESGSEGEKLIGGTTRMFAHASVDVDPARAADCIVELRGRTRSPAEEYKASVVLRAQNRAALVWLLGDAGPLARRAHVHLVEKQAYAVRELVALVDGPAPLADALHRDAPAEVGERTWTGLLSAFNDLMRARGRVDVELAGAELLRRADALPRSGAVGALGVLLHALDQDALLAPLTDTARMTPRLQPLVPALVAAVRHWGRGGRPVLLVHDQQQALTARRVAHVRELLVDQGDGAGPLVDVRLVDSRADARVQVADLLAGAARRIAEDRLDGHEDHALADLLAPYQDD
jgi:hypothetical protein